MVPNINGMLKYSPLTILIGVKIQRLTRDTVVSIEWYVYYIIM